MRRMCGNCAYARDLGDGNTVCTHDQGHHFAVVSATCRQPRRWWRERDVPIEEPRPARVVDVEPMLAPDETGQLRMTV